MARSRVRAAAIWTLLFSSIFLVYTLCYFATDALPGNPAAPLGWWGWFDQGNYIASARAFANGEWRSFDHFYPPLYPWLGSCFIAFWPAHPFFLIDFGGLALHVAALIVIGRQLFRTRVVALAIVATFAFFPTLTLRQWETPWTTSLSAGVGSLLLLIFAHLSNRCWLVRSSIGWLSVAIYSLAFGSIAAIRPPDGLVWLPMAMVFFLCIFARNANPFLPGFRAARSFILFALIAITGLLIPLLYVGFNLETTHTLLGTYIIRNGDNGYQTHGFIRKFFSLFFDSSTVYVEDGQALASRFWPLFLAFPLTVHALVRGPCLLRVVAITILVQYLLYVPYADLLPNGMFRYMNVHYFSWTLPWLLMMCLGWVEQTFLAGRPRSRRSLAAAGGVVLCTAALLAVTLYARSVGTTTASLGPNHSVVVDLNAPQGVDFIDFTGTTGSWPDVYLGASLLEIDGVARRMISQFRLVPTESGIRLILPATVLAQRFVLTLPPTIAIDEATLSARAAGVGVSFTCRFRACAMPILRAPLPTVSDAVTIGFDQNSRPGAFLIDGWSSPEDWGRWSSAAQAHIAFRLEHKRRLKIEVSIQPLLSRKRPQQTVTVTANGCPVGQSTFSFADDADTKILVGEVAESCIPPDGQVNIEIATDRAVRPQAIGLGEDDRSLGVGLRQLKIE